MQVDADTKPAESAYDEAKAVLLYEARLQDAEFQRLSAEASALEAKARGLRQNATLAREQAEQLRKAGGWIKA